MLAYMERLKREGMTPATLKQMIDEHKADRERMVNLYERYKAEIDGVPILKRKPIEYEDFETGAVKRIDNKVNNTLNNSFDAEIVDTKVGYMFGHPISYVGDKDENDPERKSALQLMLDEFLLRNKAEDEDSEWGKMAAICGMATRLAYIDKDGNERVKNINPWECIILGDDITEPTGAIRYYSVYDGDKETKKAEYYDESRITYYSSGEDGAYQEVGSEAHLYDDCPLFGLPNNAELKGDAEKVMFLIDAYDRTLSDASNEIEQYRLAYLVLKGMGMDEETLDRLKKTGAFELYDEKDDVHYLTKDINDVMIENHLDRLEENIMRFAKSVNFSDESFGTSITGVAMKFKIMALENKCITMERKMTSALRYQFKLLCSAWAKKKGINKDDYLKVWFGFKRNLPANTLEEAQVQQTLKGYVSEETRLSLFSQVDDVQYEMKKLEEEKADEYEKMNAQLGKVGEDDGNTGGNRRLSRQDN